MVEPRKSGTLGRCFEAETHPIQALLMSLSDLVDQWLHTRDVIEIKLPGARRSAVELCLHAITSPTDKNPTRVLCVLGPAGCRLVLGRTMGHLLAGRDATKGCGSKPTSRRIR